MPPKLITKQCPRCQQVLPRSSFAQIPRTDSPTTRLDALCRDCRTAFDEERRQPEPNATVRCACGCGNFTNLAPRDDARYGWVKGQPMRFIKGHNTRHSPYPPALYVVDPDTGCWNWQLKRDKDGYGILYRGGKKYMAHRFFYEQRFGPLPEGMVPDHCCPCGPNPSCVNPDHMRPLTLGENSRWKKSTKLDWQKVAMIRLLALQGVSQDEIATRFGIGQAHISRIVTGKRWNDAA